MGDKGRFHSVQAVRTDVNRLLAEYFEQQVSDAGGIDAVYAQLLSALGNVVEAGGKRIRPYLTVLAYEAYGGDCYDEIVRIAAAIELFHVSLLVHDDIADNDFVRHGVDNVAGQFRAKYLRQVSNTSEAERLANAAALLAGDVALSAAHSMIFDSGFDPHRNETVLRLLHQATFEVAGGQLLDMEAAVGGKPDVLKIAKYKTASYSFVFPVRVGAMLASVPDGDLSLLEEFGYSMGTAFQLADDLLGMFGDEAKTGKSNRNDIREGKRTYLLQRAEALAGSTQRAMLRSLIGKPDLTEDEAVTVRIIVEKSGARKATEVLASHHFEQARQAVHMLSAGKPEQAKLLEFADYISQRDR